MNKRTKALAGLAAILLCGGAWLVWRSATVERAPRPSAVAPLEDVEQRDTLGGPSNPVPASASSAALATGERRAIDVQASVSSTDSDERLRGRVTNSAGVAIVGAQVAVVHASADSFNTLDLDFAQRVASVASGATDARGEFAFELPRGQLFQLDIDAAGFACAHVPHCKAGEFVEVHMSAGATVWGRVMRRGDGSPIADAKVSVWPRSVDGELPVRGARRAKLTDGAGRYRLENLAPGSYLANVQHTGDASPQWPNIELAAGGDHELDFTLDAGVPIRGHVTDAQTGLPIAGAQIGQGWTFDSFVISDADGAYEFSGFSPGYFELAARAPGYGRSERQVRERTMGATVEVVDFAMTPARRASGRIVDESATAIAGAYVAAAASELNNGMVGQRIDWNSVVSGADGVFELADLRSDLHHTLFVRKEGFGTVAYEFPADEAQRASIELGDIVLPPAASLLGRVVDPLAQPLVHQLVELRGINRDRARLSGDAQLNLFGIDFYVAARQTRTDSQGLFRFDDLAPGDYAVSATVAGNHELAAHHDVAVERGETLRDIQLVIDRGLSIEGIVRVKDGGALPTVHVSVDPQGEGKSADCEVAGGRFSALGLSATTYTLTAYPYPSDDDRAAGRLFLPTKLEGIAAGAHDVVLELRGALRVRGKVLDSNGLAVGSAPIVARDAQGNEVAHTASFADGSFEIAAPAGERFDLEAQPPHPPSEVSSEPPPDPSTFARLANILGNDSMLELRLNWLR